MTTNNLIGYDPLAWMEGEVVEEAAEPVKKTTKSKAKAKVEAVEIAEDTTAIEAIEESPKVTEDVDVELDVSENGDIEITIDVDENVDVVVEIAVETEVNESENDVLETSAEDVSENQESPVPEIENMMEEIEPLVELGTEATLKTLSTLYETFKHILAVHDVIEINASDIATIDTATFQLLVSLKKDAPRLNKTISIICPSKRFIESAKLLDLVTILEITE